MKSAVMSEDTDARYFETKWINGSVVIDTHGAAKNKNEIIAVISGDYYIDLGVQNNTNKWLLAQAKLKINNAEPYSPIEQIFYLQQGYSASIKKKVSLRAGDIVSWAVGGLTITEFSLHRNRPFPTTYGMPMTASVQFSGGTYIRRGEYMVIYSDNKYFDRKPIYDFLPAGFDYDMNSLTFIPTDDNKIKMQVRVKGWVSNVAIAEPPPIPFRVPEESLSNYRVSGEITISTPGTYEINGKKITLHGGSISVGLSDGSVKKG